MYGEIQQLPVLLPLLVPFTELCELTAHEQQLLARVGVHIHIQKPCLGEFLLIAAVHLLRHGGLAVDVLIVAQGQQIVLVLEIVHGEGDLFGVLRPLLRGLLHVVKGVVHPAQVPLVVKAQTAVLHRGCDLGIVCGILRNEHCCGVALMKPVIHALEEIHRSAVDSPCRIPCPVYGTAYGIHAQAVKVIYIQPVVGGGLQKGADLPP